MRIEKEVKDLTKQKKFGLVFENHIPEMTLLYDYPISRGCKVIRKSDDDKKLSEDILWEVKKIRKGKATCVHTVTNEEQTFNISDLICVSENGKYPIYSANVLEPFGRIDKLILKSFDCDSVLWGIDGDWMTAFLEKGIKFYPTDHCGVIRVKDSGICPYYLYMILDIVGRQYGFSRSYRAATERVASVRIPLPPKDVQKDVVKAGKKVFEEFHTSRMTIEEYRNKILTILYKYKILEEIS